MNFLSKLFLTAWMAVGSIFGYQAPQQQPVSYGAFNPTGGATYRLQASISSTQTTITLASFKEPISNIPYTMSYLNSDIMYGTIDPQNSTSKEFISFTGITQNSNGSATLTGVTRGLGFSYPYTASSTLRQAHSGQAIFILSNTPQLYNQYANKNNDQSILGIWDYSTYLPTTSISATSSNQFANKAYVDSVAIAGAPNSTESVKGITELATQIEMASSTLTGSTGASLSLYSKYSTSSPYTTGLYIPITRNDGKLSPLFIATTSSDVYNFGGQVNFNASTTLTSTTTIAASSANKVSFNGLSYVYPSSRGSANTFLTENGSGTLTWTRPTGLVYTYASTSSATIGANTSLNSSTLAIPANILTASSTVIIEGSVSCVSGGISANNCTIDIVDNNANVYATYTETLNATSNTSKVKFRAVILSNNSTSAQKTVMDGVEIKTTAGNQQDIWSNSGTSSIDWTVARTFGIKLTTVSGTSNTGTINGFSIIVTP